MRSPPFVELAQGGVYQRVRFADRMTGICQRITTAILAACYGVVPIVGDSAELARGATFLGLVAAVLLLTLANHQPG